MRKVHSGDNNMYLSKRVAILLECGDNTKGKKARAAKFPIVL
jgi:hypothetical protein